jgi:hypothetical protein
VKHRGASDWQARAPEKTVSRETSGRAMFHVKHFCVKRKAATRLENAILQNNPMHQKIGH